MEKNHKKDLEQLLFKQTEKILLEIDPATTVIFSKNIKSHCKDLAKKFWKTSKKFQKQMEAIAKNENAIKTDVEKKVTPIAKNKSITPANKISIAKNNITRNAKVNVEVQKKVVQKRVRKGNNLMNAAAVQNKVKAKIVKNINKTVK
jgi:hypothetical protein